MADAPSHHVSRLLARWKDGDEAALQELVPIVLKSCEGWRGDRWRANGRTPIVVPAVASLGSRFPLAFGTPYRFMPGGKTLITLQGTAPNQNFFGLHLKTGEQRQLTSFDLKSGSAVQNFDISPDGNGSCSIDCEITPTSC